jgi:hypothetical protein
MKHNFRNAIDLPVMQQLAPMPYSYNYHGSTFISDGGRYIYWVCGYGTQSFYRYDIFTDGWEQLANTPVAPSSGGYASNLAYDKSRKRIYAVFGSQTGFYYYDVEFNTWSSALATLPATPNAGASLEHPCPAVDPSASDDFFYYFNGDGTSLKLYKYSVTSNTWVECGTNIIPAAPSSGANLLWFQTVNPDWLFIIRGNSTRTVYIYSISGNSIVATQELKGSAGTLGTGSIIGYNPTHREMFWVEAGSRNILKSKLDVDYQRVAGAVSSATTTSITDTTKNLDEDMFIGGYVTITSGTGVGQCRQIVDNSNNSFVVYPTWAITPDNTSQYEVKMTVFDYGKATAVTTTTLSDSTKTWIASALVNLQVKITSGTGAGQVRFITANTTNQITVSVAWTTNPDTTSTFEIVGFKTYVETLIPYSSSTSYFGNTMAVVPIKGLLFLYFSRKTANTDWFRYLITSP